MKINLRQHHNPEIYRNNIENFHRLFYQSNATIIVETDADGYYISHTIIPTHHKDWGNVSTKEFFQATEKKPVVNDFFDKEEATSLHLQGFSSRYIAERLKAKEVTVRGYTYKIEQQPVLSPEAIKEILNLAKNGLGTHKIAHKTGYAANLVFDTVGKKVRMEKIAEYYRNGMSTRWIAQQLDMTIPDVNGVIGNLELSKSQRNISEEDKKRIKSLYSKGLEAGGIYLEIGVAEKLIADYLSTTKLNYENMEWYKLWKKCYSVAKIAQTLGVTFHNIYAKINFFNLSDESRSLSKEQKAEIDTLHSTGKLPKRIANMMGLSVDKVCEYLKTK